MGARITRALRELLMPRRAFVEVKNAYDTGLEAFAKEQEEYQAVADGPWWAALTKFKERSEAVAAGRELVAAMLKAVMSIRSETVGGSCMRFRACLNCIVLSNEVAAINFAEEHLLAIDSDEDVLYFLDPIQVEVFFANMAAKAHPGEPSRPPAALASTRRRR